MLGPSLTNLYLLLVAFVVIFRVSPNLLEVESTPFDNVGLRLQEIQKFRAYFLEYEYLFNNLWSKVSFSSRIANCIILLIISHIFSPTLLGGFLRKNQFLDYHSIGKDCYWNLPLIMFKKNLFRFIYPQVIRLTSGI